MLLYYMIFQIPFSAYGYDNNLCSGEMEAIRKSSATFLAKMSQ